MRNPSLRRLSAVGLVVCCLMAPSGTASAVTVDGAAGPRTSAPTTIPPWLCRLVPAVCRTA